MNAEPEHIPASRKAWTANPARSTDPQPADLWLTYQSFSARVVISVSEADGITFLSRLSTGAALKWKKSTCTALKWKKSTCTAKEWRGWALKARCHRTQEDIFRAVRESLGWPVNAFIESIKPFFKPSIKAAIITCGRCQGVGVIRRSIV